MEPADLVATETNFQRDDQEQPSSMDAICPAEDSEDQDVTRGLGWLETCFTAFPKIRMKFRQKLGRNRDAGRELGVEASLTGTFGV